MKLSATKSEEEKKEVDPSVIDRLNKEVANYCDSN
jgi:hypothetical protein